MTKALTVRQPHATLIAVGAKATETRSWTTSYRGPLIIHAGLFVPPEEHRILGEWFVGRTVSGKPTLEHWSAPYRIDRCLGLPLGAVVASSRLVGIFPIADPDDEVEPGLAFISASYDMPGPWVVQDGVAWIHPGQEPLGDFAPDRRAGFVWLLEDVAPTTERCPRCLGEGEVRCLAHPEHHDACFSCWNGEQCPVCLGALVCPPVQATGHQGLWEWGPGAVVAA